MGEGKPDKPADGNGAKTAKRGFQKGNEIGKEHRFQPGNPGGPGAPKKDAWVKALEKRLEDENLRDDLANALIELAMSPKSKDRMAALKEIQDRVGGPVVKKVEAEVTAVVPHTVTLIDMNEEDASLLQASDSGENGEHRNGDT